jgi:hypothetical protein
MPIADRQPSVYLAIETPSIELTFMHEYSIKGHPRELYVFWIALVAIIAVPLIRQYGAVAGITVTISASVVFLLLYWIWDRFLWKFKGLNTLYKLPDLGGHWQCEGNSVGADGKMYQWSGMVVIEQTWSKIAICVQTTHSRSRSSVATIEYDAGHGYRLMYGYQNDPSSDHSEFLAHRGNCNLIFTPELSSATGNYFNDAHRKTWGDIRLTKGKMNHEGI